VRIDHVVYATSDLDAASARVLDALGLSAVAGAGDRCRRARAANRV